MLSDTNLSEVVDIINMMSLLVCSFAAAFERDVLAGGDYGFQLTLADNYGIVMTYA